MKHLEFVREIPGSRTAIVFVHGILGTPNHFNFLVNAVPEEWSIYNILLDGHGKTVDDFAASSMDKWKNQVHNLISELSKKYDDIVIVAHSMGTLFAIDEAIKNPKIKKLFLLDVPLRVGVKPRIIFTSLKIIFGKIRPGDTVEIETEKAYSITPDKRLWKYIKWIPNYLALFAEIRNTRKKIGQIHIPCIVFQSKEDELAALSSVKYFRGNSMVKCGLLTHSGHFFYDKSDIEYMIRTFKRFLNKK